MRKMVDYVVLAALAHEPRAGYDLTKWLTRVASHFWPIVHSAVYPALAALEADGLIRHEVVASAQGPERKVYAPTERGRGTLLEWVASPPPPAQVRDEQLVRALCYGYLPPGAVRAQLARVRTAHAARLAHYEELERQAQAEAPMAAGGGEGADPAALGKLLVLRCGILSERGYLQWCDEAALLLGVRLTAGGGEARAGE